MNNLAINGGKPIRSKNFPAHTTIGKEEKLAVNKVLDSGVLSKYLASNHKNFMGGPEVRALEEEWAEYFNTKYAVAVNSNTSGLYSAIGAIGIELGDEVIVPPFTMSATATAPLVYGGIPIFADIEEDYFCINPEEIKKKITDKTRAIICVDLFGHPYNYNEVKKIADQYNLKIIEDCAQAPGANYSDSFTGTISDIGVFSLNYHKHIHCGEGGVVVTDNDEYADRLRLIRNHAEAVVDGTETKNINNMIGFNYRMTEIGAAIARCQLKKLEKLNIKRNENANYLNKKLNEIPAITIPKVSPECSHVYYVHACKFDEKIAGIGRDKYIDAVKAELMPFSKREEEGVKLNSGYQKPLYMLSIFKNRIAMGSKCYSSSISNTNQYNHEICSVAESMHNSKLFINEFILPSMSSIDLDDVINAFFKVWEQKKYL